VAFLGFFNPLNKMSVINCLRQWKEYKKNVKYYSNCHVVCGLAGKILHVKLENNTSIINNSKMFTRCQALVSTLYVLSCLLLKMTGYFIVNIPFE
jgi:hypothetical protein